MTTKKKPALSRARLISLGIPLIFFPGMMLSAVLGWKWGPALEELAERGGYRNSRVIFPQKAEIIAVTDGDTVEIDNGMIVRLVGIDAPNRGEEGFEKARDFLDKELFGKQVELEYDAYQEDKFGRILAYVFEKCTTELGCKDGKLMVNWLLVKKGYAKVVVYKDRRALKYEELLRTAQAP